MKPPVDAALLSKNLALATRDMVNERGQVNGQPRPEQHAFDKPIPILVTTSTDHATGKIKSVTAVGSNETYDEVYNRGPDVPSGTKVLIAWTAGKEVDLENDVPEEEAGGQWEIVPKGGGAGRIRFTILATDFTVGNGALGCDHVVAIVTHVSCGGAGVSVGDEVKVYDPEYCHFNLPIELLVGLSGTATKMDSSSYQEGLDYILYCMQEIRDDGCIWMIDTLCCAEEEYINVPA